MIEGMRYDFTHPCPRRQECVVLESRYQKLLIVTLRRRFPGCVILKNDPGYLQGIPDLVIFYGDRWAMLEVKASATAPLQPNQDYYVPMLNEMSFAAFIFPENEEAVLSDLQRAFEARQYSRVS
jgi:hypothetical protein